MPAKKRVREGIFYLCRFDRRLAAPWEVFAYGVNGPCELSHAEWWPALLQDLRRSHGILRELPDRAFRALLNAPYAFPRGRLVHVESQNVIYWGGEPEVPAQRRRVEAELRIVGGCVWRRDEHEQTLAEDRLIADRVLGSSNGVRLKRRGRYTDVKLVIHRGARQIGGSCIELCSGDTRIVLDAGLPLERDEVGATVPPPVPGLFGGDGHLVDALFLSHAHADHSGLIAASRPDVPVWMTEGTSKMLMAGSLFARQPSVPLVRQKTLRDGKPVPVGPFSVTARPVDHSVYGAAAFMVEAEGKRILYTGDLRFHGRKPGMAIALARVAKNVDAVVIEGTRLGARSSEENLSEHALEELLLPEVKNAPGLVLAMYSPMNVDRFTTLFRTARRARRAFVIDPYQAFVLHLIHRRTKVPIAGGPADLRVLVPPRFSQSRPGRACTNKARWRPVPGAAISADAILADPQKYVVLFRTNMEPWLCADRIPAGTTSVYSYWPGYLTRDPRLEAWSASFRRAGGTLLVRHASGHGHPDDLRRFIERVDPKLLIPVHTTQPEAWAQVWPRTRVARDRTPITL